MVREELERIGLLLGEEAIERLAQSTVLVAGVGGVGSYAIEALARTGVGHLILIDKDVVSKSNLNRQMMADYTTISVSKCEAMKQRILSYHKECEVKCVSAFFDATIADIVAEADFAIDAIDTVTSKLDFMEACHKHGVPFVSSLGMGNRLDPSCVQYTSLWKTEMDPLARAVRTMARKRKMDYEIPVLFSSEKPYRQTQVIHPDGLTMKDRMPPASAVFVPASAGLLAASVAVRTLLGID